MHRIDDVNACLDLARGELLLGSTASSLSPEVNRSGWFYLITIKVLRCKRDPSGSLCGGRF